jgi:hypothetical protein
MPAVMACMPVFVSWVLQACIVAPGVGLSHANAPTPNGVLYVGWKASNSKFSLEAQKPSQ